MENQEPKALKCPMCDSDFLASDILDGDSIVTCPACARQFTLNDVLHKSKEEIIEEMRTKVEEGKIGLEYERMRYEVSKEEKEIEHNEVNKFQKSGFRVVLIIAGIISALLCGTAFNDGKIGAGLLTGLMVVCFAVSFLMGVHVIPEWRKNFRIIPAILGFLLFIPATALYNNGKNYDKDNKFSWSDIVLCDVLPVPDSNYGSIISNKENGLYITIYNTTKEDYRAYVSKCKEIGFVVDSTIGDSTYEAYNAQGFKLYISCFTGEQYSIDLKAPKKRNILQWEYIEIMENLPTPSSTIGEIANESETFFAVYVLDMPKESYCQYVQKCIEMGYNIDYKKGEDYFNGKNIEGYSLTVNYEGFNTIFIRIEQK